MKARLLSLIAMALAFIMLFSACSKDEKKTDTDAQNETTVSSAESTQENEEMHNVFGKFESVSLGGEAVDYTAFEGKITMVNIWATYCGPCIGEMPDLEKISKEYADKNFQIVGIVSDVYLNSNGSYDSYTFSEAQKVIEDTGVSYMNILPSASLKEAKLDSVRYIPETVFLDGKGNIIGSSYIGSKSYEEWCSIIDSVLEKQ